MRSAPTSGRTCCCFCKRDSAPREEEEEEDVFFDANEVLEEEEEKEHARDHEESPAFSTRAGKEEEEEEEEEETWEHRPLRLINALNESDEQELPINDTKGIDVKTSVFVGKILVRCRDVPSREGDKEGKEMTEKYFANKRRTFQTVVQGRFLREGIKCSEVITGHEFAGRFRRIPARWLVSTALKMIRKLTHALKADITGDKPFIYAPLCATAQVLRADIPGEEPDVTNTSFAENTRLFGKAFSDSSRGDKCVPSKHRKGLFANSEFGSKYQFSPDLVYTFDVYQHIFVPSTFDLHLGPLFNINLLRHLPKFEPPQIMAKVIRGKGGNQREEYLYKINMYHEKMFDEKFARASSPDALFNIGVRCMSIPLPSTSPSLFFIHNDDNKSSTFTW